MANLSFFDALLLVLYVVGTVGLGVWIGRGKQDAARYMLGGKNLPWWAILGSIVATETSTVTFLSVPGLAFKEGGDLRFLQLALGYIVGRTVIVFLLLPNYFRGRIFTVYELLQSRFGNLTRRLASMIFLVTRNLGDGLRLFLTALALEASLNWSLPACVLIIGLATIIFTFFGGIQSVVWNDCLQLLVYMIGGTVALFLIVGRLDGGFEGLYEFAQQTGRSRWLDFEFFNAKGQPRFEDTYTFWAGLIGGAFLTLGTHGTDQMFVQRLLASRSQRDAGRALILSGFFVFIQFALFLVIGIALASFYASNSSEIELTGDRVFSEFIVHEMPAGVGIVGLLMAAIFSASMSTLSSSLNSSATTVVADWLPRKEDSEKEVGEDSDTSQSSDKRVVRSTRVLTVIFGIVQIVIAIWAASFNEAVISNALAIAGFASGLLLGLFALGLFAKSVGQQAAVIGLLWGLFVLCFVKFGFGSLPEDSAWRFQLAWPWLPVIGSLVTFLAGWIASFVVPASEGGTANLG